MGRGRGSETTPEVLDWLLEPSQPAVRYRTLTDLLGRPETDPEVREARARIPETGWAAEILAGPLEGPSWYRPKYVSDHWKMIVLGDLGASREDPRVAAACERWMDAHRLSGGGVGGNSKGAGHHCVVGNMTRALIRMGYEDDPRVRRSLEWIVETADPKGGWSCFGSGRNLDSWEGLSALAAYPRARWTEGMRRAAEAGAEFFLERELHRQGGRYAPWYRFHDPVHYYYDVLVGLDLMARLGHADDPRLEYAWALLAERRRPDARWNLDAVHPDVEGPLARWMATHPGQRPTPWALEEVGAPSRWITLRALTALSRRAGSTGPRATDAARSSPRAQRARPPVG